MKDRTLIVLAVLFLIFSIGSGVNKSLEAGNRTMGKPMAPDLSQLYSRYNPVFTVRLKEVFDLSRQKTEQVYNSRLPAAMGKINRVKTDFYFRIKNQTQVWQNRFFNIYHKFKNKSQDKKNMVTMN